MQKRMLEITTKPTYILSTEGKKIFIREAEEMEDNDKNGLYEMVCTYFPYLFLASGWFMFFMALFEIYR